MSMISAPLVLTDSAVIHDIAGKAAFLFGEIGCKAERGDVLALAAEFKGYYDSRFGRLWARWERRDGGVRLEVDIPAGMKGRLVAESGWQLENGGTELDLPVGRQTILLSRSRG